MSFSPPAPRRKLHTRAIVCEGYLRDDGLYDIEASILDTKSYDYTEAYRGERPAGSPLHDMRVRLTIDDNLLVHDIEVEMPATPYPTCSQAVPNFRALVGVNIGPGWRKAVQNAAGGAHGCTHVRELLFPMATVAYQTLTGWRYFGKDDKKLPVSQRGGKPYFIDGCIAWASDGEVVARLHPEFASTRPQAAGSSNQT
jgi:hypothetical protein